MTEPFLAEIRIMSFGYAPRGWALCNGQILPIAQNQALFSLLGTVYGGNGQTTFALPDLRGRTPIHTNNNVGLGQMAGEENHTLTLNEMPQHIHQAFASGNTADAPVPAANLLAAGAAPIYAAPDASLVALVDGTIGQAGGSQPHSNMMPYLTLNFCIALQGIFPSRN